ncbi:gamma-glutamylcyclotransferase family protein [Nocardia vermiculata]|uniref:Putative gamma-glutamylcyclotransferase n=1 Tax=Nocardia vermiculata TaxID=257274 RepID=A0A846Y251_9NOCA|nr:gamma-glutamylcyclotransferase family protein [Nocardia vermiculata]NKY53313.1 gamma-glutamylcyclotransferase [Nocardia vermiculata]
MSAAKKSAPQRRARPDDPGPDLFAYGTLQFGPVLDVLLGRTPEMDVAVARGWRVAALPQRLYPGLVAEPGRMAGGVVLSGLTAADWRTIEAFEDPEFDLRPIELIGRAEPVRTFVWSAAVTGNEWLPEGFVADHLERYVERATQWQAERA